MIIGKNDSFVSSKGYDCKARPKNEKVAVILGSSKTPEEIESNLKALGKSDNYINKIVKHYKESLDKARLLGVRLAAKGYKVLTGAGPGIMENANSGARQVESQTGRKLSYAVDASELSNRWRINDNPGSMPYVFVGEQPERLSDRTEFFHDKADIVFAFEGGPGTQEEVSLLQEKSTYLDWKKHPKLVFMDREYFAPQEQWHKKMEDLGLISPGVKDKLHTYADTVDEAMQIVENMEKEEQEKTKC